MLTQGSLLASHAHRNQTSPVHRGIVVRENMLCQPLDPPPLDVNVTPPPPTPATTTRERFANHEADPMCAGCHVMIDPIGLAFEHYDAIGAWRTTDGPSAVDASGEIIRLKRHRLAPAPPPPPKTDPIAAMLDRVLATGDDGATEQAWLARQLEAAARAKETLTVTVRMPGGQTADYLLAPASVANGRLRARDRKADIERTLPLSAIAAVAPAPSGV